MGKTLKETITEISANHLAKGYLLFGQCLTAVGYVGGTVPNLTEKDGLVETCISDVMNGGIVVGAALVGKRPIYVVRYQAFQWFNGSIIANYAGKSKEAFRMPCPIFIRSVAMEGGIGPTSSSSHHGIFLRMPGINIASPMTPKEYKKIYDFFMANDDPMYVSEHKKSFDNSEELDDIYYSNPDVVLFPFSITRFETKKAHDILHKNGLNASVHHQLWIRPTQFSDDSIDALINSKYGGLVLDDDYPNGIAKQMAYELMIKSGKPVQVLCLDERVHGFQPHNDNLPPTAEKIANYVLKNLC